MDFPNPLTDTNENASINDMPSPSDIEERDREHATVGWVNRRMRECPTTRRLRAWSFWFAFGIGAIVVFNAIALFAGRAVIRETVREVVREELDIRGMRARVAQVPASGVSWEMISSAQAANK